MNLRKLLALSMLGLSSVAFAADTMMDTTADSAQGGMRFSLGGHIGWLKSSADALSDFVGQPDDLFVSQADFNGGWNTAVNPNRAQVFLPSTGTTNYTVDYQQMSPTVGRDGIAGGVDVGVSCENDMWSTGVYANFTWMGHASADYKVPVDLSSVTTVADIRPAAAATAAIAPAQTTTPVTQVHSYSELAQIDPKFGIDVILEGGYNINRYFGVNLGVGYAYNHTKILMPVYDGAEWSQDETTQGFHGYVLRLVLEYKVSENISVPVSFIKRFFVARTIDLTEMDLSLGEFSARDVSEVTYGTGLPLTDYSNSNASTTDTNLHPELEQEVSMKASYSQSEVSVGVRFKI